MNIVLFLLSLFVLCFSAYTDIKDGKVLNEIVFPSLVISMVLQLFNHLLFGDYLIRILLIAAVFFFYEGFIGAGDAKIFMVLCMAQGPYKTLASFGIASLIIIAMELFKNPKEYIESVKSQIVAFLTKTTSNIKGEGKTVKLIPLVLAGFLISTLIFGI